MQDKSPIDLNLDELAQHTKSTKSGANNQRAFVGPPAQHDSMGATQFRLVTFSGLQEGHSYLDLGCGSLRAGKLILQYLLSNRYCDIEPSKWHH